MGASRLNYARVPIVGAVGIEAHSRYLDRPVIQQRGQMMEHNGVAPCQMCGSPVRERRVKGDMTFGDSAPPIEVRRTCTNPQCDSNTGSMSIADVV